MTLGTGGRTQGSHFTPEEPLLVLLRAHLSGTTMGHGTRDSIHLATFSCPSLSLQRDFSRANAEIPSETQERVRQCDLH